MKHYVPYSRTDTEAVQVAKVVEWLGVKELLAGLRQLSTEKEFLILLDFLVEFSGGLETSKNRMEEMMLEQAVVSYKAYSEVVRQIKGRIFELYKHKEEVLENDKQRKVYGGYEPNF